MKISNVSIFFKEAFNIKWEDMKINEIINVESFNKKIKSFNYERKENEFKLVKNIIRKQDSKEYQIFIENKKVLSCSEDHKIAYKLHIDKKEFSYLECNKLIKLNHFYVLNENNHWVIGKVKQTNNIIPILDFEVEGNHNYFSEGILSHNTLFGNPVTQSGGNSYKYYSSIRVEVFKKETLIENKTNPYGIMCRLKTVKNKVACPYRDTIVKLLFGKGYDVEEEWVEFAVKEKIIEKTGAWFTLPNSEKFQGLEKVISYLKENKEYYQTEIIDKTRAVMFNKIINKPEEKTENIREIKKEEIKDV